LKEEKQTAKSFKILRENFSGENVELGEPSIQIDAFPSRALPRSGSNRCSSQAPSTRRVASGSIIGSVYKKKRTLSKPSEEKLLFKILERPTRVDMDQLQHPNKKSTERMEDAGCSATCNTTLWGA